MIVALADTHATVWYITNDLRLSAPARTFIARVAATPDQVGVSTITFVEVVYLVEKGRIPADILTRLFIAVAPLTALLTEVPLHRGVIADLVRVPRADVPDMPDRIIAATALSLGVPVISRDGRIRASGITTVW